MKDLIDRQAAIDGLKTHYVERITLNDWQEGWNNALEWVEGVYLDELPSAQPEKAQLSQEDVTFDCISRQAAIDGIISFFGFSIEDEYGSAVKEVIMKLPSAQPELSEVAVNAMAVEEMLVDLLPERDMREIEGDEAKNAVCETVHDALAGLWKLPFVKPNSKELSLTQKALDTISRHAVMVGIQSLIEDLPTKCKGNYDIERLRYLECLEVVNHTPSTQPEVAKDTNVLINDCISRQAAIDAFYEMASDIDHLCDVGDYVKYLENASSAQLEIIRCKDCKYRREDIFDRGLWCEMHPSFDPPSDDWFCGSSERRTDGEIIPE